MIKNINFCVWISMKFYESKNTSFIVKQEEFIQTTVILMIACNLLIPPPSNSGIFVIYNPLITMFTYTRLEY